MDSTDTFEVLTQYLDPTAYIDSSSPTIQKFALKTLGTENRKIEKAVRLFYAVRDKIEYNPYAILEGITNDSLSGSIILKNKICFGISKAILLTTLARASDIPTRIGFFDIEHCLPTPFFNKIMGKNILYQLGYTEFLLFGRWIKCLPVFSKKICKTLHLKPLEFTGLSDAILQKTNDNVSFKIIKDYGADYNINPKEVTASIQKCYASLLKLKKPPQNNEFKVKKL